MLPQTDISYLPMAMIAYDFIVTSIMLEMVQGVRLHRTLNCSVKIVGVSVKSLFTILLSEQLLSGDVRAASKRREMLRGCFSPHTPLNVVCKNFSKRRHKVREVIVKMPAPPLRIDPGSVGLRLKPMVP